MKKPFAAAPSHALSLSHSLLAAVDGGAGDVQQQLGSPSDQTTPSAPGPREPVKELTKEEKRDLYEKYKDSDTKPMWMMNYKPE
jgi:hypothetical protein